MLNSKIEVLTYMQAVKFNRVTAHSSYDFNVHWDELSTPTLWTSFITTAISLQSAVCKCAGGGFEKLYMRRSYLD